MAKSISFARGAPSLDIIDVEGLRAAADAAFEADPGGMTAYGIATFNRGSLVALAVVVGAAAVGGIAFSYRRYFGRR